MADYFIDALPASWQGVARQFSKFVVIGLVGAVIDFSVYNFLTRVIGWTSFYEVFGYKVIIANNIAVFLAIISNFFFNKYWTFHYRQGSVVKQGVGYFAFNTITWVLNQMLVSFFTFNVPLFEQLFGGNKDNAAKVMAIAIILFFNFFGGKFLIFRSK